MQKKLVASLESIGNERERAKYFRCGYLGLSLAIILVFLSVKSEAQSIFAQPANQTETPTLEPIGNLTETSTTTGNATRINIPDSDFPVLEKISDKGLYTVQLRFTTFSLLPRYGFDMEILFLDPQNPQGTSETVTQTQTNFTAESSKTSGYIDPSIVLHFRPVESYDLSVYSDTRNTLWQEIDRPVAGGRAFERIVIENDYSGPVTFEIDNIRPVGETLPPDTIDSVSFTTEVESS